MTTVSAQHQIAMALADRARTAFGAEAQAAFGEALEAELAALRLLGPGSSPKSRLVLIESAAHLVIAAGRHRDEQRLATELGRRRVDVFVVVDADLALMRETERPGCRRGGEAGRRRG